MTTGIPFGSAARALVIAAAFVVVIAGLQAGQSVLVPFVFATFISVAISPPILFLIRRQCPAWLAVILVIAGLLAMMTGFAAVIGHSVNEFTRSLPTYQSLLRNSLNEVFVYLNSLGIDTRLENFVRQNLDPGKAMQFVATLLASLGSLLTDTFLIVLTVAFILVEASSFPAKIEAAFGKGAERLNRFSQISESINRYLVMKTWISLLLGVLMTGWVWLLNVDFPLLWGLLAFLLNYIPNIGSIVAAVPPILLAAVMHGPAVAAATALGYIVANLVLGNIVEPRYMGREVGLSPLAVFACLVFWGWLWGTIGMLLSVPLTMAAKIALETDQDTRWLAILIGEERAAIEIIEAKKAGETAEV